MYIKAENIKETSPWQEITTGCEIPDSLKQVNGAP